MVARKYSASMDEDLLDEVKAAADAEGTTVSAWLAELARDRVALLGLDRVVTEWEEEHGKFTEEEIESARADFAKARAEADHRVWPPVAETA